MDDNFKIGIIGGKGKMGEFFTRFFQKKGYEVLISDKNTKLDNRSLLKETKVIILSVPMSVFPQVVEEIANLTTEKHWVLDVCSLKLEPYKVMRSLLKKPEVLATHPLFGPYEPSLKGKTIAYFPIRGKNLLKWFSQVMCEEGLKLVKIPPKKHDQIMGLVQVLNHFWLILLGNLIKQSGFTLEEIVSLATPSFLKQLEILQRLAYQDEKLYGKIQLDNPYGKRFRNLFYKQCQKLIKVLNSDQAQTLFETNFKEVKALAKELENLLKPLSLN
ncbi:prephenate dehydrogenase/arogenate dehydrogenase family protein [Thermodesulfobacterium sp. TA1]|uniref:prephenate dehydrogenase/arogenate dehydrogenase family protein n=1 Tax=Thermodesulfobacterium sp. TA1 TaxID=2234087 RepID=UPI00123249ED|nr:prephenate dehydrogenase/arogenate dehydrogenase family protein [Thermodesulfobacterium sp. TA1]QER41685.1 prephenate dehydrogenase/arogenate dehydrogenase family protein [Thermodesulfobacterium sp. TA1]